MIVIKKILYITNKTDLVESNKELKQFLSIKNLAIKEVVYMQNTTTTDINSFKNISGNKIKTKLLYEKKLLPHTIMHTADKEDVAVIIINFDKNNKSCQKILFKELIHKSIRPVLFYNNQKNNNSKKKNLFSNVIFATNWSPQSENAFKFILSIKKILGTLDIVNVINKKLTIKDLRELKKQLAETRKTCLNKKIDAESHIYAGKVPEEIILSAKDYKSTLIIIGGASKKSSIYNFFKKQISYKVAIEAAVPVLVI